MAGELGRSPGGPQGARVTVDAMADEARPSFPTAGQLVFPDASGEIHTWVSLRTPEGRTIVVTAGTDATIRIWDPDTGRQVRSPIAAGYLANEGAMGAEDLVVLESPDGPLIAYVSRDGEGDVSPVGIWNPLTGTLARQVPTTDEISGRLLGPGTDDRDRPSYLPDVSEEVRHVVAVPGVAGAPRVVSYHVGDRDLVQWDPAIGTRIGSLPRPDTLPETPPINLLTVIARPDAQHLLASTTHGDGLVRVSDVTTGRLVVEPIAAHPASVTALCPLRREDGQVTLVSAGTTSGAVPDLVRAWDPVTGTEIAIPLTVHCTSLAVVKRRSGGDLLAGVADGGTIEVWDLVAGTSIGAPIVPVGEITTLQPLRGPGDRLLIAAAGGDGESDVEVWDPRSGELLLQIAQAWPMNMAALPRRDGTDALVITNESATVEIWDPVSGKRIGDPMYGHAATYHPVANVYPLVLQGDNDPVLITAGNDGTLRRWDLPGD